MKEKIITFCFETHRYLIGILVVLFFAFSSYMHLLSTRYAFLIIVSIVSFIIWYALLFSHNISKSNKFSEERAKRNVQLMSR